MAFLHWILRTGTILASVPRVLAIPPLDYSCNPAGAITVRNPDPDEYLSAVAKLTHDKQECSVLKSFRGITFVIYDCPISHNIDFTLLKSETVPDILTGDFYYYVIRCQQIPATGVYRRVTDKSWVTNYISSSMQPSVTPTIILDSEFQDIESGFKRTSAIVGQPLRWEIIVPGGYIALPLNCTAKSGAEDEEVNIVQDGCSLDTYRLTHFEYDSTGERQILVARLYAFRFADSDLIVFECSMLVCEDGLEACDFRCPGVKKKKRSFDNQTRRTTTFTRSERTAASAESVKTTVFSKPAKTPLSTEPVTTAVSIEHNISTISTGTRETDLNDRLQQFQVVFKTSLKVFKASRLIKDARSSVVSCSRDLYFASIIGVLQWYLLMML